MEELLQIMKNTLADDTITDWEGEIELWIDHLEGLVNDS